MGEHAMATLTAAVLPSKVALLASTRPTGTNCIGISTLVPQVTGLVQEDFRH